MKEFCPHCGAALPADAEFCPNCGQARPSSATATNTQSTTAPTTNTTAAGEQATTAPTNNTVYLSNAPYNESPQPGLITSTQLFYRDIFKLSKRMGRADYWWAILGSSLIGIAIYLIIIACAALLGTSISYDSSGSFVMATIFVIALLIYIIITSIATITAQCRRFHDISYSAAFWFLNLIPMVGGLVVFIFMVQSSKQLNNPY